MFEGRAPIPICNRFVRASFNKQPHCLYVRAASVAQHHRFDEGRPIKIVDVIQWCVGFDKRLDDVYVTEMCCGDQRRAVERAGYRLRVSTELERKRHHLYVVFHGCNRDDIVALMIHCPYVRTALDERSNSVICGSVSRDEERRPARIISAFDFRPHGQSRLDCSGIILMSRRVQPVIRGNLAHGRRRLGQRTRHRPFRRQQDDCRDKG